MKDKFSDPEFLEDQRRKTIKEFAVLKHMVYNWKNSYLRQVVNYEGDNLGDAESWEFLCKELMAEIEDHLYPYVQRFKDMQYITPQETSLFMRDLYVIIDELRQEIPKVIVQKEKEKQIKEEARLDEYLELPGEEELADVKKKYNDLLARLEALEGE